MYGVDVAVQRADDLDRRALSAVVEWSVTHTERPTVLEIGAGAGGQTRRFLAAGADVVAVDIIKLAELTSLSVESAGAVTPVHADVRDFVATLTNEQFTFCHCQRVLHYLPYSDAERVLTKLTAHVTDTLFLSVTGLTSAIGEAYTAAGASLPERFGSLTPTAQADFSITAPVCLYTHKELLALLRETGWEVIHARVSAFGNSKVCATPRRGANL
jgi:SAM-dependent methyltransferase